MKKRNAHVAGIETGAVGELVGLEGLPAVLRTRGRLAVLRKEKEGIYAREEPKDEDEEPAK
jgi:hypothetical protein